jgi:hypothetical protein
MRTSIGMKNPPHPGDFIRTEIIQPAGLSYKPYPHFFFAGGGAFGSYVTWASNIESGSVRL